MSKNNIMDQMTKINQIIHNIKTPLVTVNVGIDLIGEHLHKTGKLQHNIEKVIKNSQQAIAEINNSISELNSCIMEMKNGTNLI